ncbi:No apical meristem (NAM) protein [Corchorus capsularis]|uniref:No apical meristem (NAM) protein n=1 Tax=Corchorus capsularis TaxID=210143 RepID=A0A1R3HPU9_COCAP|nr:No apical meristem (NAM) protein [Corchorus capsularis]
MEMGNMVQECDLYGHKEPWEIWDMFGGATHNQEDVYFFTQLKKKSCNGSRINRSVGSGTWKGEDSGKEIKDPRYSPTPLGFRKRFRYEDGNPEQIGRWILHEYRLSDSLIKNDMDYVLCRLRKNERGNKI